MEAINGITFEDWAAASANLVAGMSVEDVCKVLGVEQPVWEETADKWANELGNLMAQDMKYATLYGEAFNNPKTGKFANVQGGPDPEEALKKVPDFDTYQKIFWHQSIAAEHGIDLFSLLESEYGMNMSEWSMASSHWSKYYKENVMDHMARTTAQTLGNEPLTEAQIEASRIFQLETDLREKWTAHFNAMYSGKGGDVASDINF